MLGRKWNIRPRALEYNLELVDLVQMRFLELINDLLYPALLSHYSFVAMWGCVALFHRFCHGKCFAEKSEVISRDSKIKLLHWPNHPQVK